MNLFECIGGGSSELQETVLWTNSSPTSNFASQTVTLSDDINNYEYLKVYYRVSTTNSKTISILVSIDDFKTTVSTMPLINPAGVGGNSGNPAQRQFYYASDTTLTFAAAVVAATAYNNAVIPTAISGLKYASPKPSGTETTLWENSSPTADFSGNITLSDSINNYKYIKIEWKNYKTGTTDPLSILVTPEILAKSTHAAAYPIISLGAHITNSTGVYTRFINYQSVTGLGVSNACRFDASGQSNSYVIPLSIKGIS